MPLPDNAQAHLSSDAISNINEWLTQPKYAQYRTELEKVIADEDWHQLEDAFFKVIEFGTGGRRGIVGMGSNRINRITIGESTQALCEYAKQFDEAAAEKGIVIACDTRLSSPELSQYVALVAAANGFKTYIFESFRSTPELSFAVRQLGCAIGVVVTASHNAPEYNGFKAYWSDGAQLVPPHDKGVLSIADSITHINTLPDFDEAVKSGQIIEVGKEIDDLYIEAVLAERLQANARIKVAYSPLHGAGQRNTLPVLERAGHDVVTVTEQMSPDGNFPTMEDGRANPEKKLANERVVALMLSEEADIAISNDPDADRLGIMVRHNNEPVYLSGNQTAVLITEYALRKMNENNKLTPEHYIAKTIVTTDMLQAVADKYKVECVGNLHVGFKWICEVINIGEPSGRVMVTGSEESFGLMKGSYTRDKDGAVSLLAADYASELKEQGKTLYDRLLELYKEYGLYAEYLSTAICEGSEGFADMQRIMASLRKDPIAELAGYKVTALLDYSVCERYEISSQTKSAINMIKSNVLVYEFGDSRRRITIRPSGTEPIMKFYVQWYEEIFESESDYTHLNKKLEAMALELEGMALERK